MSAKRNHYWPALFLFFLSPAIGELLSGSAPPAEFFNPITLLLLVALYGSGAILIRELRVRWNKGWPTILALGAAYGIIEEGLMVKSFFDPHWVDLGLLGTYGRWAGVNWVWSLELIVYHAVFSIAIPILLVDLIFPDHCDEPWLSWEGMLGMAYLMFVDVAIVFLLLTEYRPPVVPYVLSAVVAGILVLLARRLPARLGTPRPGRVPRPLWFALVGFGATLVFFFIHWLMPEAGLPVALTILAAVSSVTLVGWGVWRMSRYGYWENQHRLALAAGALGFFVLLSPLQELNTARPDNPVGMSVVGLVTLLLLIWLWLRGRHAGQERVAQPE